MQQGAKAGQTVGISAKMVNIVPCQLKASVFGDHLCIQWWACLSIVQSVMMPTIDLKNNATLMREQHEKIHALSRKTFRSSKLPKSVWVIMKIHLRYQRWESLP